MADFFSKVPTEMAENLRYRVALRKRAERDIAFRRAMLEACKADVLFFAGAWCFCYEPRPKIVDGKKLPNVLPFIPWKHQIPAIRAIKESLGYGDIGLEKSRGEGASWIAVILAVHDFLFSPMSSIGLVSRNEKMADDADNPDSLGWKLSWLLSKLPKWMVPPVKRQLQEHTWKNEGNGSNIAAYAATGDVARGGRRSWFLMDELAAFPTREAYEAMASTQQVTFSRFFVSTPKGSSGAYYEAMHEPSSMVKVILDWKDNPTRNRGLYRFVDGKCVAVDPVNNPLPENYWGESLAMFERLRRKGFKLEGKLRSPWYDRECDRPMATPQNIAQELDRDYGGSVYRVFTSEFFEKAEETARDPFHRMRLSYNPETLEADFEESSDGRLLLWVPLDSRRHPPKSKYVMGADICAGLGGSHTSNSTIVAFDCVTMEQVLEYAVNTEEPGEFADSFMAVGRWLYDAYGIWECNFGGAFSKRIMEKQYPNVYYRDVLWKRGRKKRKEVGWWTDARTKQLMFGSFSQAVRSGDLKIRSKTLVEECGQYVLVGEGQIEHQLAVSTRDENSKGKAHGDRVVAACVAYQGLKDRPLPAKPAEEKEDMTDPPRHTMAWRQREYERAQEQEDSDWDDRDTSEWVTPGKGYW